MTTEQKMTRMKIATLEGKLLFWRVLALGMVAATIVILYFVTIAPAP